MLLQNWSPNNREACIAAHVMRAYPVASIKLQVKLLQVHAPELALLISVGIIRVLALAVCLGGQVHNPLCLVAIPFPPTKGIHIWECLKVPDGVQACM